MRTLPSFRNCRYVVNFSQGLANMFMFVFRLFKSECNFRLIRTVLAKKMLQLISERQTGRYNQNPRYHGGAFPWLDTSIAIFPATTIHDMRVSVVRHVKGGTAT